MNSLFSSLEFGALTAPNRVFMAPFTRRYADAGHVATALMAEHYAWRVSVGWKQTTKAGHAGCGSV